MNAGLCRALLSLAFAAAGAVAYGASFSTLITTPSSTRASP